MPALVSALVLAAAATTPGLAAQEPNGLPPTLAPFAQAYGGIGARELERITKGDVSVQSLRAGDKDEVALLGYVVVAVPRSFYAAHAWDVAAARESPAKISGIVQVPATSSDFEGISLTESEAKGLRKCRPLHCGLKLPANGMAELSRALAGSPRPIAEADSLMRAWLAKLVTDYRARGDSALPTYDDTRLAEHSADGFALLLEESAPVLRDAPGLAEYLRASPSAGMTGSASAIQWTVDHPEGLAPIVSVVQRTTYTPGDSRAATLLVTKQLYANHYFDARLDVTALADGPFEAEAETYALVVRRVRFDKLSGGGMFDLRGRVVRKLRGALRDELTAVKARLEAAYAHRDTPASP